MKYLNQYGLVAGIAMLALAAWLVFGLELGDVADACHRTTKNWD